MTTSPLQLMTYRTCLNVREYKGSNNPIIETAQFQSEHLTNILQTLSGPSGRIFLKIIKRVAFQSGRIGMPNPVGMESSFQSGWNGMRSFHSVWNTYSCVMTGTQSTEPDKIGTSMANVTNTSTARLLTPI